MIQSSSSWPWKWEEGVTDFLPSSHNFKDITGTKFGKLTASYPIGKRRNDVVWVFDCTCGEEVVKVYADVITNMQRGNIPSCGCAIRGINSKQWKGFAEIPKDYVNNLKHGAETRGLEFDITVAYMWQLFESQNRKCALSGVSITFDAYNKARAGITASLDRIDNSKGYVEGNVQWVHKKVNQIKMNLPQEEFIELCRSVVTYQEANTSCTY